MGSPSWAQIFSVRFDDSWFQAGFKLQQRMIDNAQSYTPPGTTFLKSRKGLGKPGLYCWANLRDSIKA